MPAKPAPLASVTIGDIKITYLPDGEGHFIPSAFMPASTEEGWELHRQWLDAEARIVTTFGGFLIETGDRKVAVDLGFGDASVEFPGFGTLTGGRFPESLKQTGVTPEEIDTVIYTHMHVDHTGWTATNGHLTFADARHVAMAAEWEHWQQPDETGAGPVPDTVAALSNRLEPCSDGDAVAPGVNVLATPGPASRAGMGRRLRRRPGSGPAHPRPAHGRTRRIGHHCGGEPFPRSGDRAGAGRRGQTGLDGALRRRTRTRHRRSFGLEGAARMNAVAVED